MHPWVFGKESGISTFMVCLTLALCAMILWVARDARRRHWTSANALDALWFALPIGLLGARIGHLLFSRPQEVWSTPSALWSLTEGFSGLSGGLCAAACTWFYTRIRGLSFAELMDIYAPGVVLGLVFVRLGCLSAGCCFGRAIADSGLPWGVIYPNSAPLPAALQGISLHPLPAYEALACLGLFIVLRLLCSRISTPGRLGLWAMFGYGLIRATTEGMRHPDAAASLSNSGWPVHVLTSLLVAAVAGGLLLFTKRGS